MIYHLQITKVDQGIQLACHAAIAASIHYSLSQLQLQYAKGGTKAPISKKKYLGRKDDQEMLDSYKAELYGERGRQITALLKQLPLGANCNITLPIESADELLAMLNDRRMDLGEEFSITEEDMEERVINLKTQKARAMGEIAMLSVLQEYLISALSQ